MSMYWRQARLRGIWKVSHHHAVDDVPSSTDGLCFARVDFTTFSSGEERPLSSG